MSTRTETILPTEKSARITARHEKAKPVRRVGLKYEDHERIVQVVRHSGGLGIICELKGDGGHRVKFSVSRTGAKVLSKLLNGVLRGKAVRWTEPAQMVWMVQPE